MTNRADRDQPHRNVFVKPEPITKRGILARNPKILCIYGNKGGVTAFEPYRQKSAGTALGSIFKKAADTSAHPKMWMGKVGEPSGLLRNDRFSIRTTTRKEINISVTQEKIAADVYEELSWGMFDMARTRLSNLPVVDCFTRGHLLADEWVRRGINDTLRVMSRFIEGYQDFTQARTREGGRDYSFMGYIQEYHRPPDFLLTEEGTLVPLKGLVDLLAVGRIVADTDMIGGNGGNAGFKWIYDNGIIVGAQTAKIDPACAFQFDTVVNWLSNTFQRRSGPQLNDVRDIQIATMHQGVTIKWESMTAEQKDAFLSALQNCGRYLLEEVLSFLFYREGKFQDMPARVAQKMTSDFREWVALQFQIFREEISAFKRENPLHQLRIQYIDKWGELPLLLSEENVLISEFFTPLIIKERREIEEEQADPMERISAGLHSAKTIEPHQLFVETRHVLLSGPPGAGKSTFSQEIAHRWASGKLFNDRFHAVYWIPLRKLNKEVDPGGFLHGITDPDLFLARAIANILLEDQSLTDACLHEIKDNRERTLLILDGYDEATIPLSRALLSVFSDRELSILLTSRAGFTDRISTYIDQTIENSGFTDDGVRIYATRFFTRRQVSPLTQKRADDFLKAIKKTPDFFEISHNPLQLQILCSLWESGSNQKEFPVGITGLYQSMINQLFRWEYHRREQDVRSISGATKRSLFSTLGLIAQRGLADGKLIISELDVAAWLEGGEWSEKDLLETGLLKLSGSGANICYHFQHQTFQEYLAAYWIGSRPQQEQEAFIQTYRDHPRYRVVIPFLAGITYQRDATPSKEATKGFFQALCQDVVLGDEGANQELVQIIIKSINECPDYMGNLPAVEALFHVYPSLLKTEAQVQGIPETPLHTAIRQGQIHFLKWFVTRQRREVLKKTTSTGLTPMHAAAMNGDVEMMQWLHEKDPELVRTLANDGSTPMHFAAMFGRLDAMQWLHVKDSGLFSAPADDGWTPMHIAAGGGQLGAMQWLHDKDPELFRIADDGWTPIHYAAYNGKLEAMQWLYDKDSELFRAPEGSGCTPMDAAAQGGQLEAMEWLHERDPQLLRMSDNFGSTLMHWAAKNEKLTVMQWLYDRGPELVHKADSEGRTPMHFATWSQELQVMEWLYDRDPELIYKTDNQGCTPMHEASQMGSIEAMQWLHDKGPELVHKTDDKGRTLMHFANWSRELEVMEWLYDRDPELVRTPANNGETPMHSAAEWRDLEAMQWLYDKDFELIRTPANNGETPMHSAASMGQLEAMQWLYDRDFKLIRTPTNDGETPMHSAAGRGQLEAMQWLYDRNPELIRRPTNKGKTPMHRAALHGQLKAIEWLYDRDPELVRTPANDGDTPIHVAAMSDELEIMQWLHDKDPQPLGKPTNYGGTPMHSTALGGNVKTMEWIHERNPSLFRKANNIGRTPMHSAAWLGKLEAMQWLYEKGPDLIHKTDKEGQTPMHPAAEWSQLNAMQWLYGIDPELIRTPADHGYTPMCIAVQEGQLEAMQWLYDKDPGLSIHHQITVIPSCALQLRRVSSRRCSGYMTGVLSLSIYRQSTASLPYTSLLWLGSSRRCGGCIKKKPELLGGLIGNGWTLMHSVVSWGGVKMMQWVHKKDPQLFGKADNNGYTPMHAAAFKGSIEATEWLYEKDPALIRKADNDGCTSMHLAAQADNLRMMQWLHDKDPQLLHTPSNDGATPIQIAALSRDQELVEWLHEKSQEGTR